MIDITKQPVTAETVAEVRAIAARAKRLRASLPSDSALYSAAWRLEALAGEAIGHFEAAFQKQKSEAQ